MIRYFVSYMYVDACYCKGISNLEVEFSKPINSLKDLEDVENELIERYQYYKVVVINWRRFEGY